MYVPNKHKAEKHIVFAVQVMHSKSSMAVAIVASYGNRLLGFWADKQRNGLS